MRKTLTMQYALHVLHKHRTALEVNLSVTPGIQVNINMLSVYKKQLREVRKAIDCLEKADFSH